MVLGQAENECTVVMEYPCGWMRVCLHNLLPRIGVKAGYPLTEFRKMCKFIATHCVDDDVDRITYYITTTRPDLLNVWELSLKKARRQQ